MRRRYKPFAHLPLSCEYTLVELDMSELVSAATLLEFSSASMNRGLGRRVSAFGTDGRELPECHPVCTHAVQLS